MSLRDIASEAGVNKGLVYMYVGTKDQLVTEVWRRAALDTATRMAEVDNLEDDIALLMHHPQIEDVRLLAWAALEADDPGSLFGPAASLGLLADVVQRNANARGAGVSDAEARVSVAIAAMLATASARAQSCSSYLSRGGGRRDPTL